jgi:uncharacterized protein (UPF0335 family)
MHPLHFRLAAGCAARLPSATAFRRLRVFPQAGSAPRLGAVAAPALSAALAIHRLPILGTRFLEQTPMADSADDRLRLLIERVERLEEEKKGIQDDIKDVYGEAKATGYDAKIMKQIVRIRKMKPDDRREMEAILQTYMNALGIE